MIYGTFAPVYFWIAAHAHRRKLRCDVTSGVFNTGKMATNAKDRTNLRVLEENDGESVLVPSVPNALPYQYEPRRPSTPATPYETDSEVSSDSESEENLDARVGNADW